MKCLRHPKYKALRKPTASCRACYEMWNRVETHKGYMCGVAWQHEVGETEVELYQSPEACRKARGCTNECGIVEVEVRLRRWVRKQDIIGARRMARKKRGATPP